MFEKFNAEARRVFVAAQEEARRLAHDYIGTEHVLLGLIRDHESIASQALATLGLDLEAARKELVAVIGRGTAESPDHLTFTPRAKKILDTLPLEAALLGHHYIGTEHILLGLLREDDGIAAQVLDEHGVRLEPARARIIEMVGTTMPSTPGEETEPTAPGTPLTPHVYDPAMVSVLFVAVALVAVVIEPSSPEIRLWGLSLLLGGTLLWAGGAVIGTGDPAGPRSRGMGRLLRVLGGLTLAAAASLFVLGALLR